MLLQSRIFLGMALCALTVFVTPALGFVNTVSDDADALASVLFPGDDGLVFNGGATLDFGFEGVFFDFEGEFIVQGATGGRVASGAGADGGANVAFGLFLPNGDEVPSGPQDSIGTFVNPEQIFGIGTGAGGSTPEGIVISSGSIFDFDAGPNNSASNTTVLGTTATVDQSQLLSEVTGEINHFDTTSLTIPFTNTNDGAVQLDLFTVFGTEETPDFVNTGFNDGVGIFLNGVNIALSGGLPLNINHPGQTPFIGTELDSVVVELTPDGLDPRINASALVQPGDNLLEIILGDANDEGFDSTAFISRDIIDGPSPGAPLLPNNAPGLGQPFEFDNIDAEPNESVIIDPDIAIGYVYDASQPSGEEPLFASVLVNPAGNDEVFDINFNGTTATLLAGEVFEFTEPVETFSITGIDPGQGLPAGDPLAFLTVVTFANAITDGQITQLPITEAIPEPSSLLLMLPALLIGSRRRAAHG